MARDIQPESSREKDVLAAEDKSGSKKGRGLLHVPSRSSSQRIQPSPTATGLSGATASDPRDSIGGHSKESKASMLDRKHIQGVYTNKSGIGTGPTVTPGTSQPGSPAVASHKKKKGGGFLALFGCCGVPDHANGLDPEEPIHKLDKIPPRPATASRRPTPSEQPSSSKTQLFEKEPAHNAQPSTDAAKNGKRVSGTSTQDQSTVGDRDGESKQTTLVGAGSSSPVISVEVPHVAASSDVDTVTETIPEKDGEGDIQMTDADGSNRQAPTATAEETYPAVPPPPPGPVPAVPNAPTTTSVENPRTIVPEQQQRYLLPPQAPEFKGKKCLVLDLDETLVHSSFKVRRPGRIFSRTSSDNPQILHQADFTIPVEIEGNYHNVYVIKRPGVDQFMKRVGELYEVVVFTASVSKVSDQINRKYFISRASLLTRYPVRRSAS